MMIGERWLVVVVFFSSVSLSYCDAHLHFNVSFYHRHIRRSFYYNFPIFFSEIDYITRISGLFLFVVMTFQLFVFVAIIPRNVPLGNKTTKKQSQKTDNSSFLQYSKEKPTMTVDENEKETTSEKACTIGTRVVKRKKGKEKYQLFDRTVATAPSTLPTTPRGNSTTARISTTDDAHLKMLQAMRQAEQEKNLPRAPKGFQNDLLQRMDEVLINDSENEDT